MKRGLSASLKSMVTSGTLANLRGASTNATYLAFHMGYILLWCIALLASGAVFGLGASLIVAESSSMLVTLVETLHVAIRLILMAVFCLGIGVVLFALPALGLKGLCSLLESLSRTS